MRLVSRSQFQIGVNGGSNSAHAFETARKQKSREVRVGSKLVSLAVSNCLPVCPPKADMTWPSAAALARMRVEFLNRSLPP
jgi:hypothetical protein